MKKKMFHKSMAAVLVAAMTATGFAPMTATNVQAQETTAPEQTQTKGTVTLKENGTTEYVFGNGYLKRTFNVSPEGVLTTKNITNYRTDQKESVFTPEVGSEEFVINTMDNGNPVDNGFVAPEGKLTQESAWVAETDSIRQSESPKGAMAMFDGDNTTYYHSDYADPGATTNEDAKKYPHNVYLNFGSQKKFNSLRYQQRLSNGTPTIGGRVNEYKIYVGDTKEATTTSQPVLTGNFKEDNKETYANFKSEQTAQWVRIEFVSGHRPRQNGYSEHVASCSEFDFFTGTATFPEGSSTQLKTSEMKVVGKPEFKDDKGVKTLTFTFAPKKVRGVDYTIKEVVTMKDGDPFMKKHLEISVPKAQATKAKIDYMDLEITKVPDSALTADTYWTIPEQTDNRDMAGHKGDYLELGQPYYLGAMYWGCEFPQAENKINAAEKWAYSRYFYGKALQADTEYKHYKKGSMKSETNGETETLTTWNTVLGAARSTEYSVVQSDFFEYIETIATDTKFRQQYNSWYDNMKNITDASIQKSFFEVEKGFTQKGIEPLDSYVVDDGWINYESFWDFNGKFPNELYNSSAQVQNMGSQFGLWLGPRGGYGTETKIANWIQNHNLGSKNNMKNDINISDARYLNKLRTDIFLGYQDKFDINYWKLDGMLLEPATVQGNHHIVIPGKPVYTISETYERWTDIFEDMRENRKDKGLWINLTSFVNPSPWHVQWVNSVWMQNSGDTGYTNKFNATTEQKMLTYRDNCYYDFVHSRQWQLPNKYFYNHDPVYGVSATDCPTYPGWPNTKHEVIKYTTDEMRNHLYMLGTRGTAFWEYYYSPSMFDDDKWQVNAEAARWIESNFNILQKSKMFGGKPEDGAIYGYSCWNGNEGIISIRNPKNEKQTYDLKYDRLIGVKEGLENVYGKVIVGNQKWQKDTPLKYNDTIKYELEPQEVLIIQYGKKDDKAPEILSVKGNGTTLEVEFDETIQKPEVANFTIPGFAVSAVELKADRRTAKLTLDKAVKDGEVVTVTATGVKDIPNNATANATKANDVFKDGIVTGIKDKKNLAGTETFTTKASRSIDGKGGFSVTGKIKTSEKNVEIASQKDAYRVAIDANGYLTFECNGMTVTSKNEVRKVDKTEANKLGYTSTTEGVIADGNEHQFTAVKEVNGMIKIYLDGKVVASKYDEKQANLELKKAETVFAKGFKGDIAYVTVTDYALAYDKVATLTETENKNVVLAANNSKVQVKAWNVTAKKEAETNNQRPKSHVNDGNKNHSNNYFELADTTSRQKESRYIQFDLGDEYELNKIQMWRYADNRTYGPTTVVLSNNPDFPEGSRTVVYNSDRTGNVHKMGVGTDAYYQETNAGKELWNAETSTTVNAPVKARYIRLYVNGQATVNSTSDHIVEFEAYGKKAASSIVVPDQVLESVKITSAAPENFKVTDTYQATAEYYSTGADVTLSWASDKTDVATVDAKTGLITAVGEGTANITVTATQTSGNNTITKTDKMTVTVAPAFTGVELTVPATSVEEDKTLQATVAVTPAVEGVTYTWKSSNENVATVDTNGLITAKVAGTVDITVTATKGTTVETKTVQITVTKKPEVTYTVTAKHADGTVIATKTGTYNTVVRLEAPATYNNKTFVGWIRDGKLVSTNRVLEIAIPGDVIYTASYEAQAKPTNAEANIINAILTKRADGKANVKFVAQLTVPEGYKVIETGLAVTIKDKATVPTLLNKENGAVTSPSVKKANVTVVNKYYQFGVNVKGLPAGKTFRAQVYAKVRDAQGNETWVFSTEKTVTNQ